MSHTELASMRPPVLPEELVALVESLLRQKGGLESLLPQLSTSTTLPLQQRLAAVCRTDMTRMRRGIEELKLQVDDLPKARDRAAAAPRLTEIEECLAEITHRYREAVVTSKRAIDLSMASAREQLFQTASQPGKRRAAKVEASGEDALMSATSQVTEGLRRTMELLQSTLDSSFVSNEMLDQQSLTMQMTSDQYSTFSSLLTTSKALITSLQRADVLDRFLLAVAFIFFILCCLWIVKRRIVDKGLRVAGALGRAASGGSAKHELRRSVAEAMEVVTSFTSTAASVTSVLSAAVTTSSFATAHLRHPPPPQLQAGIESFTIEELAPPIVTRPVETPTSSKSESVIVEESTPPSPVEEQTPSPLPQSTEVVKGGLVLPVATASLPVTEPELNAPDDAASMDSEHSSVSSAVPPIKAPRAVVHEDERRPEGTTAIAVPHPPETVESVLVDPDPPQTNVAGSPEKRSGTASFENGVLSDTDADVKDSMVVEVDKELKTGLEVDEVHKHDEL